MPIDEEGGRVLGLPQPVTVAVARVAEVTLAGSGGLGVVARRGRGEVLALGFDPSTERRLGEIETLAVSAESFGAMSLSPDGLTFAHVTQAPRESLVLMDVHGENRRRLIDDEFRNRGPAWTPDGGWIAFYSNRSGSYDIWAVRPDGSELIQVTDTPGLDVAAPCFSPDGARMAVVMENSLAIVSLDERGLDGLAGPLGAESLERQPDSDGLLDARWSPDGERLGGVTSLGGLFGRLAYYSIGERRMVTQDQSEVGEWNVLPVWLGSDRLAYWDRQAAEVRVWDLESGELRTIDGVPGPGSLLLSPDARRLYVARHTNESDLWLLTLQED